MIGVNKLGHDWLLIRRWVAEEIDHCHARMEAMISHDETNYERGQLNILRRLLREVEPEPTPEVKDVSYD